MNRPLHGWTFLRMMDRFNQTRRRKRKRRLYSMLRERIEFYLSEPNMRHDPYICEKYNEEYGMSIKEFLCFNRIKDLTTDIDDIKKALADSTILEVDSSGTKVRHREPIKEKKNIDECTLYVENVPDVDPPFLQNLFSCFGTVDHVSIPRYKANNKPRGFAFVEFRTKLEADRALEDFKQQHCLLPVETEPQNLMSISTMQEENTAPVENFAVPEAVKSEMLPPPSKKPKLNPKPTEKKVTIEVAPPPYKKSKKHRKKKKYLKNLEPEIHNLNLMVLPKKEWKRLRNKYLTLQAKQRRILKHKLARHPRSTKPVKSLLSEKRPGTIIQVDFMRPLTAMDAKAFKTEAKALENVAYADMEEGELQAYIRMNSAEAAQKLLQKQNVIPWKISLLPESLETEYWEKAERDREEAYEQSRGRKRKRGSQRLQNKIEKIISKELFINMDE